MADYCGGPDCCPQNYPPRSTSSQYANETYSEKVTRLERELKTAKDNAEYEKKKANDKIEKEALKKAARAKLSDAEYRALTDGY